MEKTPSLPEGKPSADDKRDSTVFQGTENPRHLRVLHAALRRSLPRRDVDAESGSSNGPDIIAALRRRGIEFPCVRIDAIDRDGRPCRPGVYNLTKADRRKIIAWIGRRDAAGYANVAVIAWLAFCSSVALVTALGHWL